MTRQPFAAIAAARDARPGVRAIAAVLSAHQDFIPDPIPRHWHEDHAVEMLTRVATSPATITGSGWADSLAATALPDFLLNIGPASVGSALLKRCLSLQFNGAAAIRVPSINTSASPVGFVGEAAPIPAQQLSITSGVTLAPRMLSTTRRLRGWQWSSSSRGVILLASVRHTTVSMAECSRYERRC